MYDTHSKGISYTAGFFMLIAFAIGGIIIAGLISIQLWTAMTGRTYEQFASGMTDPAFSNVYKIIQVINMLGFLVPALIVAHMVHRKPLALLGFSPRITGKQIALACMIMVSAMFIAAAFSHISHLLPIPADWKARFDKLESSYSQQAQAILGLKNFGDYVLALIVMGFLPAICEETLFRGGLQNFLTRSINKPWIAIVVVSLIFSLAHMSFYGFLSRFFLGVVLGIIYHYSGKLWLCIIGHFLNNAMAITLFYYAIQKGKAVDVQQETGASLWSLTLLPVLVMLFLFFKRESKPAKLEY
ncbi:MAG: CPBP family intramembrane metalloprotease [Chitinophagaceae bacterium]|nr:CPBP family intramembrane metalloprotease [Chitinophagaceae bacterium]